MSQKWTLILEIDKDGGIFCLGVFDKIDTALAEMTEHIHDHTSLDEDDKFQIVGWGYEVEGGVGWGYHLKNSVTTLAFFILSVPERRKAK